MIKPGVNHHHPDKRRFSIANPIESARCINPLKTENAQGTKATTVGMV
jgi:hypothetical protein